jgi:hypothetical protein
MKVLPASMSSLKADNKKAGSRELIGTGFSAGKFLLSKHGRHGAFDPDLSAFARRIFSLRA